MEVIGDHVITIQNEHDFPILHRDYLKNFPCLNVSYLPFFFARVYSPHWTLEKFKPVKEINFLVERRFHVYFMSLFHEFISWRSFRYLKRFEARFDCSNER